MSSQVCTNVPAIHELYGQGYTTQRIAEALGVKNASVRSAIHRERKRDPAAWDYRRPGTGKHERKRPDAERLAEQEQWEREKAPMYLAGETLDLTWTPREVAKFDSMWQGGYHIADIAALLGRNVAEVAILCIDRAEAGRIESRTGGVFGSSPIDM